MFFVQNVFFLFDFFKVVQRMVRVLQNSNCVVVTLRRMHFLSSSGGTGGSVRVAISVAGVAVVLSVAVALA